MAIDPVTMKVATKVTANLLLSKKGRRLLLGIILIPLFIIIFILASPVAIFLGIVDGNSENPTPIYETVYELQEDFKSRIKEEQEDASPDYIKTIIMGSEDGELIDNTEDVLIGHAIAYNKSGKSEESQMLIWSADGLSKLEKTFWEMNIIHTDYKTTTRKIEVITVNEMGEEVIETQTIIETTKTITVNSLDANEFGKKHMFTEEQMASISEMQKIGFGAMIDAGSSYYLSQEEIKDIQSHIEQEIDPEIVVKKAKSIVSRVHYFWGGKSNAIGWDSRWGERKKVVAEGSQTTGTYRPFGLDCSGYVAWVFINAGCPISTIEKTIGYSTSSQWRTSTNVSENQVQKGDLAFLAPPGKRKINHVGIVVGKDDENNIMVAHCSAGKNNVTIDRSEEIGFAYYRRPAVLIDRK